MFKPIRFLAVLAVPALLAGCAGPEKKLGRGIANLTEFAHGGEIARSMEQTTLWEGTAKGNTVGLIRGLNRSVARTVLGAAEVVTFFAPLPNKGGWNYDPLFTPDGPLYPDYSMATYNENWGGMRLPEYPGTPDSYDASWPAVSSMDTDDQIGITGGSVLPFFPFGRFIINEQ